MDTSQCGPDCFTHSFLACWVSLFPERSFSWRLIVCEVSSALLKCLLQERTMFNPHASSEGLTGLETAVMGSIGRCVPCVSTLFSALSSSLVPWVILGHSCSPHRGPRYPLATSFRVERCWECVADAGSSSWRPLPCSSSQPSPGSTCQSEAFKVKEDVTVQSHHTHYQSDPSHQWGGQACRCVLLLTTFARIAASLKLLVLRSLIVIIFNLCSLMGGWGMGRMKEVVCVLYCVILLN